MANNATQQIVNKAWSFAHVPRDAGVLVSPMQPKPDDTVCDPACGTSGFLLAAHT